MEQIFKPTKDQFKKVNKAEIEEALKHPATRKVRVKYRSGCGCGGGSWTEIEREVPWDSDLHNGDQIYEVHESDRIL